MIHECQVVFGCVWIARLAIVSQQRRELKNGK